MNKIFKKLFILPMLFILPILIIIFVVGWLLVNE